MEDNMKMRTMKLLSVVLIVGILLACAGTLMAYGDEAETQKAADRISEEVTPTRPGKVKISAIKINSTGKIAAITWKRVNQADGYVVYRYNASKKKYEKISTVTKGTTVIFKDKKVKRYRTYKYKVRAYKDVDGQKLYGSYSKIKSVKCVPTPAKGSVKNAKQEVTKKTSGYNISYTSSVKLTWKKLRSADKYVIYRRTGTSGKWTKIITTEKTSYQDKNVKQDKIYYYRMRAYKRYGGKNYYGDCSTPNKVKVIKTDDFLLKKYNAEAKTVPTALKIINEYRAQYGLEPYKWDSRLERGALIRAKELTYSFSHTRPNGLNSSTAYTYLPESADVGEAAIVSGASMEDFYTNPKLFNNYSITNATIRRRVELCIKSPGHRVAILCEQPNTGVCVTQCLGNLVIVISEYGE